MRPTMAWWLLQGQSSGKSQIPARTGPRAARARARARSVCAEMHSGLTGLGSS